MAKIIRELFSTRRPIDRTIEKVIDYYAQDEARLASEIGEYEITDHLEACFEKFLDKYRQGVSTGQVSEVGIWVSGFYGSGKSSFTKYLGFALDAQRKVGDAAFMQLLCDRFTRQKVPALLKAIATQYPTAVIFLDLGAEQLADSAATAVTNVLYYKVLQQAGYSKEKKLARLELTLERQNKLAPFQKAYRARYHGEWEAIHNDPLLGVARAAEIVPAILPEEFKTPDSFRGLRFEEARDVRDVAKEMIEVVRRKFKREAIIFLLDEAGQYVAPRGELILNLDGLARNLKELGQGKVWLVGTGQQTLTEIVQKAALNSAELNKLRDRFPISIHLEASDIREITHRRLLAKSPDGEKELKTAFATNGQALCTYTRLTGTTLFKGDPQAEDFVRFYPFLPQHFDLLLEMIRTLARSTGGIGLRSAIRVIQDVLVDKSRVLPPIAVKLADRPMNRLACVDDFYDTLRADIARTMPHVVAGVEKVERIFGKDSAALRVAKAVAALQPVETFPRTAENIAALLYPQLGSPSLEGAVRTALSRILAEKECGLIEDPQVGGYVFLSEGVKPLRDKRNSYVPTSSECGRARNDILKGLFAPQPSARLENVKEVKAAVKVKNAVLVGEREDIEFRLEFVDASAWEQRRTDLLTQTNAQSELKNAIVWLAQASEAAEDMSAEIVRSETILADPNLERLADKDAKDVAQFLRAERKLMERHKEEAAKALASGLLAGTLIFRGRPTPAKEVAQTIEAAARQVLDRAAKEVFPSYRLCAINPPTDVAAKFLAVERLDRISREQDPLALVVKKGGQMRVDTSHPVLAELLRAFRAEAQKSGTGRLEGRTLQDFFSSPPYGWSKDAVRYLFAALLSAGEIELHTSGGVVKTAGPLAQEALKSTVAFNRVGVAERNSRVPIEALDRAAKCLEELFGENVLPLEDNISRAVRKALPDVVEKSGSLTDRLRLLGMPGEDRARNLIASLTELLKGDAASAPAVLGAKDCALPDDIRWALGVAKVLNDGAEQEIRDIQTLRQSLAVLESDFPGRAPGLLPPEDQSALEQALASERFHEQLPNLRNQVRGLRQRAGERYASERQGYAEALKLAQTELERLPDWGRLEPDDQQELASRLTLALPEKADAANPLRSVQTVLVRRSGLAATLDDLKREVSKRVPTRPDVTDEREIGGENVQEVAMVELLPAGDLKSKEEVETWVTKLRQRLLDILKGRKVVRIKGPK